MGILPNSFWSQNFFYTNTGQRNCKKRKLQTNIPCDYWCKDSPQNVLEEVIEKTSLLVDPWARPRQPEAPHPLPSPWIVYSLAFPILEVATGTQLSDNKVLLRPSGWHTSDGTQLRHLYKLLRFWWVSMEVYLWLPKTSLVCRSPCLLNVLPTNLECLPLSLVSPYHLYMGAHFRFHPGNSWVCELTIGEPARRPKKWALGKRHTQGKSWAGHQSLCGEGDLYVRCLWTATWTWGCTKCWLV